jgi:hypothetical protein
MPRPQTLVLLLVVLLAACAHVSVLHLNKASWVPGQETTLATRHWTFIFRGESQDNRIVIRGTALPRSEEIPDWATWAQDLWMQVYLSDATGQILAKDLRLYLPQDIRRGIPLEFHMEPKSIGTSGPLSISFGYRMELTAGRNINERPEHLKNAVFFASQGALFQ